jgi:hypothetical protein
MTKVVPKKAIFSVDVERSFHDSEKGVYVFLKLLERHKIKATFFVTVDVLLNCPEVVAAIQEQGHEVASHGYHHLGLPDRYQYKYLDQIDFKEAEQDIFNAFILFQKHGYDVAGFRAPGFRINRKLLSVVGRYFKYDSSTQIMDPFKFWLSPQKTHSIPVDVVKEIPVSCTRYLSLPLGSPYFFGFGSSIFCFAISRFAFGNPLMLYSHCFDLISWHKPKTPVPFSKIKMAWYHKRCGPQYINFFDKAITTLKNKGIMFVTARSCIE